jgi:hypothetical protein
MMELMMLSNSTLSIMGWGGNNSNGTISDMQRGGNDSCFEGWHNKDEVVSYIGDGFADNNVGGRGIE